MVDCNSSVVDIIEDVFGLVSNVYLYYCYNWDKTEIMATVKIWFFICALFILLSLVFLFVKPLCVTSAYVGGMVSLWGANLAFLETSSTLNLESHFEINFL